jgi:hypothetical protein
MPTGGLATATDVTETFVVEVPPDHLLHANGQRNLSMIDKPLKNMYWLWQTANKEGRWLARSQPNKRSQIAIPALFLVPTVYPPWVCYAYPPVGALL